MPASEERALFDQANRARTLEELLAVREAMDAYLTRHPDSLYVKSFGEMVAMGLDALGHK